MSDDAKDWCPHCGAHWPRDEEERTAAVEHLRFLARMTSIEEFRRAFNIAADHIENGEHRK